MEKEKECPIYAAVQRQHFRYTVVYREQVGHAVLLSSERRSGPVLYCKQHHNQPPRAASVHPKESHRM